MSDQCRLSLRERKCLSRSERRRCGGFTAAILFFTVTFQSLSTRADENVAATVNGASITVAEVEREAARATRGQKIPDEARPILLAATLSRLIDRRLVNEYLIEKKHAAKPAEIDLAISRASDQLAQQKILLDDHLRTLGMDRETFRADLAWRISWKRYFDAYATEANLARYFDKHRPHFDGGQRRVAHILFPIDKSLGPAAEKEAVAAAEKVRAEIEAKSISFADAARKYSAAPTAEAGGDIGFISRREPMPESFSRAAFDLAIGRASSPVVSPFGVHLIACLEERPGQRTWEDAKTELREAVNQYLFDWIAERRRKDAQIEFSGKAPHFKPGSRELATP